MKRYAPECPFCGREVEKPVNAMTEFGEVLKGKCLCKAVYVCDPTGHNAGEAYMEVYALVGESWNLGEMDTEADIQTGEIDYDLKTHQRLYSKGLFTGGGKLIFARIKPPVVEEKKPEQTEKVIKGNLKKEVKKALEKGDLETVAGLAQQDKAVLRTLVSLAYNKDEVLSWRAIEAMGRVAEALNPVRLDAVRDSIRRLLWSMGEESGGIGWTSAEMLGEIIRSNPETFSDIIPIVWSFREEENFRAGTIRAMGRVAEKRRDLAVFVSRDLREMFADKNPEVRGNAAWTAGILGTASLKEGVASLLGDEETLLFYLNGELHTVTVGALAREALEKMDQTAPSA
ncbi:MAG: HEAT repeat domain-containing protein [Nitrospirales bacterium]|nr:HEAT repeat domain-containing protein [Nitrospirales bacterium]